MKTLPFFGVQEGNRFDFVVPPEQNSASGLLGWTHLRSAQIGNDILAEIGSSNLSPEESGFPLPAPWVPGATGFEAPLMAGDYTFWLRQGSDVNITVELDFETVAVPVAVPESFSLTGTAVALGLGWLLRKKAK
ncbi:MAG: PEP-CTERM sorting domain-containing protein [Hydrococcus sp. RM1_1_31]|nr:PEP-CTERM sorting domain-containing protein [Hydrococcus sp. RM1_1_31]